MAIAIVAPELAHAEPARAEVRSGPVAAREVTAPSLVLGTGVGPAWLACSGQCAGPGGGVRIFGFAPVGSAVALGATFEFERMPVFRSRSSGYAFGGISGSFGTGFGADNELALWLAFGAAASTGSGCSGGLTGQGGVRVGHRFYRRTMFALSLSSTVGLEPQFCDSGSSGANPPPEAKSATLLAVEIAYDLVPAGSAAR